MDFTLTADDAETLRHLASVEPMEARTYLQDRPELVQRMAGWPPEIRIEVCRILYRSFPEKQRHDMESRRHAGSNLLDLLGSDGLP